MNFLDKLLIAAVITGFIVYNEQGKWEEEAAAVQTQHEQLAARVAAGEKFERTEWVDERTTAQKMVDAMGIYGRDFAWENRGKVKINCLEAAERAADNIAVKYSGEEVSGEDVLRGKEAAVRECSHVLRNVGYILKDNIYYRGDIAHEYGVEFKDLLMN
ncbi:TPA: hypothetical protein ACHJ1S_000263 [Escherichia coli]|uniref:hypothetical protein n=1 Tax=Escherichia coli TaxID=562 RepID=UPI0007A04626|nr:hypothetical protein [Escherichia coli]EGJ6427823.1 hypothetical protein [Escherichia coli]ELF7690570.1 hypothetical protein [Escherichia coli]EME1661208.1 hypothetical protein [Escherichia coli]KYW20219.1 hypothetical protein AMK92_19535 [Escherichia coli]OTE32037.1 hypothetical protein AW116_14460 [Escherichia coli]